MQAVAFPLEDGLALHENMRFVFPDTPNRQRILKQGSVKIGLFPPPKGTTQIMLYLMIFSVMLSLLSGHTIVGVINSRHIRGTQVTHIKNILLSDSVSVKDVQFHLKYNNAVNLA